MRRGKKIHIEELCAKSRLLGGQSWGKGTGLGKRSTEPRNFQVLGIVLVKRGVGHDKKQTKLPTKERNQAGGVRTTEGGYILRRKEWFESKGNSSG